MKLSSLRRRSVSERLRGELDPTTLGRLSLLIRCRTRNDRRISGWGPYRSNWRRADVTERFGETSSPFLGIIRFYQCMRPPSSRRAALGIAAILPQSSKAISSPGRMVPSTRTTP